MGSSPISLLVQIATYVNSFCFRVMVEISINKNREINSDINKLVYVVDELCCTPSQTT